MLLALGSLHTCLATWTPEQQGNRPVALMHKDLNYRKERGKKYEKLNNLRITPQKTIQKLSQCNAWPLAIEAEEVSPPCRRHRRAKGMGENNRGQGMKAGGRSWSRDTIILGLS